jgi:outer membrane protein assembly factor BamB
MTFQYMNCKKIFFGIAAALLLSSCSGFFDKDNTPAPTALTDIKAQFQPKQLWSVKTGTETDDYLKLTPSIVGQTIYATGSEGRVSAINKTDGRFIWQINLKMPLMTGPGVGDGLVVIGSRYGEVIALNQSNGQILWKQKVLGELLAKPAIGNGTVIVKTIGGHVTALSSHSGEKRWSFNQAEPALTLYGSSTPLIKDNQVIIGFANGNLAKLSLSNGQLFWLQPIAKPEGLFAIQRMIDIDADPILFEHQIFAATFQGQIASLNWFTGQPLWSRNISSYTGMAADQNTIYVTDAKSDVWAFDTHSGAVNWKQTQLEARIISAPAIMNSYIVVGDAQGYLHWLDRKNGHFAARTQISAALYTTPLVENNILYVLTRNGYLAAYKI